MPGAAFRRAESNRAERIVVICEKKGRYSHAILDSTAHINSLSNSYGHFSLTIICGIITFNALPGRERRSQWFYILVIDLFKCASGVKYLFFLFCGRNIEAIPKFDNPMDLILSANATKKINYVTSGNNFGRLRNSLPYQARHLPKRPLETDRYSPAKAFTRTIQTVYALVGRSFSCRWINTDIAVTKIKGNR